MNLQETTSSTPKRGEPDACSVANSAKNATVSSLLRVLHRELDIHDEPLENAETIDDSHGDDHFLTQSVRLALAMARRDTQLDFDGPCTRSAVDDFGSALVERFEHFRLQRERLIQVYTFVYNQYGHTFRLTDSDEELWLDLGMCGYLEVYLKWKTGELLAAMWQQSELPVPSNKLDIFSHRWPRFGITQGDDAYWRKLRTSPRKTRRAQRFVYSLYQSKAGALPLSEEAIKEKVEEAAIALISPGDGPEEIGVLGRIITKEDIRDQLVRTVREVYGVRKGNQRKTPHGLKAGSSKSCSQSSRSMGGAHEYLTDLMDASCYLAIPTLVGWAKYHERVAPVYSTFSPEMWSDLAEKSRRLAWSESMDSYPVGLPEPFKVRVITKGPAHHYHTCRRWQPEMWRPLSNHPTFELTGAPNGPEIMRHFLAECDVTDGRLFTSGDYAAATDHLDSDLSESCLEAICDCIGVPLEDRLVLRDSLTRHTIQYKTAAGQSAFGRQQKGQLMGSPISFPILCLFNAALTRFALEVASATPVSYRLDELPMLINGDDLLCRTSDLEYLVWKDIVKFGGLTPSIGKNFRHKSIATINSEMWRITTLHHNVDRYDETIVSFYHGEREPIIELGLARGSMKNGTALLSQEEQSPFRNPQTWGTSKEVCWRKFLNSCPDQISAYDFLFESVGHQVLSQLPTGMPLCVPTWLGGSGFPLPPADHPLRSEREPSDHDLKTARYMSDTYGFGIGRKYLSALNDNILPASVEAEMDEDDRLRTLLQIPPPQLSPVKDGPTPLTPLPNWMFLPLGSLANERGGLYIKKAEMLWRGIRFVRTRRHGRGPLPVSEFRDSPPPLHREQYVFEGVVG